MATTYTTPAVDSNVMPDQNSPAGMVLCRIAQYVAVSADTVAAGDTVQMVPIPKGAQILNVCVEWSAQASTAALSVGTGDDTDLFFSAIVATNLGRINFFGGFTNGAEIDETQNALGGMGYEFTADDTIDILFSTAGMATGDVLTMAVYYVMSGTIEDQEDFVDYD
jgi:hypothetical protein